VIPGPHRMKGGAAQLGVTVFGRRGPFGVCGEEEPECEQQVPGAPCVERLQYQADERSNGQRR